MSEIEKSLFNLYKTENGEERFCGTGFAVSRNDRCFLTTSGHVVFKNGEPRRLVARSFDGAQEFTSLSFHRESFIDLAEHEFTHGYDTYFEQGCGEQLKSREQLKLQYMAHGRDRKTYKVKLTRLGSIDLVRRDQGNIKFKPEYDVTVDFEGVEDNQVVIPGASGTPLLTDQDNKVLGVVKSYRWINGKQRAKAITYTTDNSK